MIKVGNMKKLDRLIKRRKEIDAEIYKLKIADKFKKDITLTKSVIGKKYKSADSYGDGTSWEVYTEPLGCVIFEKDEYLYIICKKFCKDSNGKMQLIIDHEVSLDIFFDKTYSSYTEISKEEYDVAWKKFDDDMKYYQDMSQHLEKTPNKLESIWYESEFIW
jgi:hypothetical protein